VRVQTDRQSKTLVVKNLDSTQCSKWDTVPRCVWCCNVSEVVKCIRWVVYVDVIIYTTDRTFDIVRAVFYPHNLVGVSTISVGLE